MPTPVPPPARDNMKKKDKTYIQHDATFPASIRAKIKQHW